MFIFATYVGICEGLFKLTEAQLLEFNLGYSFCVCYSCSSHGVIKVVIDLVTVVLVQGRRTVSVVTRLVQGVDVTRQCRAVVITGM